MRQWVIIMVVALVALSVLTLTLDTQILWDGGYKLAVHIENRGQPIRVVRCGSAPNREYAEVEVSEIIRLEPSGVWPSAVADPYEGQPLSVQVPVSGRDHGLFGWKLSRTQFQYLAVVVIYADGQPTGQVVEIPDGRVSREVTVSFP